MERFFFSWLLGLCILLNDLLKNLWALIRYHIVHVLLLNPDDLRFQVGMYHEFVDRIGHWRVTCLASRGSTK